MNRYDESGWEHQAARYTRLVRYPNGGRDPYAWKRDRAEDDPSWTSGHDRAEAPRA